MHELTTQTKFQILLDTAIEISQENQKNYPDLRKNFCPIQWNMEFCTIAVDFGRRLGKSSYIRKRARSTDIIIATNTHSVLDWRKRLGFDNVFTKHQASINFQTFNQMNPEFIWIDDARLTDKEEYAIYEIFTRPNMNQMFIKLGK